MALDAPTISSIVKTYQSTTPNGPYGIRYLLEQIATNLDVGDLSGIEADILLLQQAVDGLVIPETVARVPTSDEVTAGELEIDLDFVPASVIAQVRVTATGVLKNWDGGVAITTTAEGGKVTLDNSGSTDWAVTDTVSMIAFA